MSCEHGRPPSTCPECDITVMIENYTKLEMAAEVVLEQLKNGKVETHAIQTLEDALCKE